MATSSTVSNTATLLKYLNLPQPEQLIIAEYVWIDSSNGTRSKSRTLKQEPNEKEPSKAKLYDKIADFPDWNFDGSSTDQAPGNNSDVYLRPVAMYPCPFRLGKNVLIMCETYNSDNKTPNKYNFRADAAKLFEKYDEEEEFWFGIEQEYTLLGEDGWPYGWPKGGFPGPQGPYYCGNGTGKVFCRDIVEAHYKACMYAGLMISGTNAEVMPAQWEFQVGPCHNIDGGDHLWMARFILHRVAEDFGAKVTFHPKPIPGDWNGAGLHTNVSTKAMRTEKLGGMKVIEEAMEKLSKRHVDHMKVYGEGNEARMTGKHETASYDKFTWGIANRGSSVRVNRECADKKEGYFEDRRPASNADPYQITGMIVETLCGSIEGVDVAQKNQDAEQVENTMIVGISRP